MKEITMNPNMWNIKEILSIPNGSSGPKITSRNEATSDYSSLTDSQFLFGSQFLPDNMQGMLQDTAFSNRTSGSSQSQEASEPKPLSSYHTKPFLLGNGKDKVKAPCFSSGKSVGVLDKFEEDKKRAKEKLESDILTSGFLRDNLECIKLSLNHIDQSTMSGKKDFADFEKRLQQNIASLQEGFAQQFEALQNKLSTQNQMLKEMDDRAAKTGVATTALSSHMQGLLQNLEFLRHEQSQVQRMLGEVLGLTGTLVSELHPVPVGVMDSMVQTSPGMMERFSQVDEENRHLEDVGLCVAMAVTAPQKALCGVKETGGEAAEQLPSADGGLSKTCNQGRAMRRCTLRGHRPLKQPFRSRRRALVPPQRCGVKARGQCMNQQPIKQQQKQDNRSTGKEQHDPNWVHMDSVTEPQKQQRETVGYRHPFRMWSQECNQSVCVATGDPGPAWDERPPEPRVEVLSSERKRGFWHLFDINCDSD
ncbi:interactor of HORMAD1 protein 1 isoform X1 [Esox lucius]|uniref:Coiled-coil domain containing 36 n=2 Tax=Esox lucius TaxID=8010 RepID=A0AAY5K452_ESOLU|nr:interactor of HORMAD1 protein 1 isoform X1 [Esox lucius]